MRERDDVHILAALLAVTAWGVGPILTKAMTVSTPSVVLSHAARYALDEFHGNPNGWWRH